MAQLARAIGSYPIGRRFEPYSWHHSFGLIAQFGRASALQAEGRGFDPHWVHQKAHLHSNTSLDKQFLFYRNQSGSNPHLCLEYAGIV